MNQKNLQIRLLVIDRFFLVVGFVFFFSVFAFLGSVSSTSVVVTAFFLQHPIIFSTKQRNNLRASMGLPFADSVATTPSSPSSDGRASEPQQLDNDHDHGLRVPRQVEGEGVDTEDPADVHQSILTDETSGNSRHRDPSRKNNKTKKKKTDQFKQLLEAFHSQVLDPTYVQCPLRATTVESATQYAVPIDMESSSNNHGLLPGTHKHLGGAYDPSDGCIYGVPANSRSILCLSYDQSRKTYQMSCIPIPDPRVADMRFKWLRGIVAHGRLWAIPSWADKVLCVDLDAHWKRRPLSSGQTSVVQLIDLPSQHQHTTWQWHGAGINPTKTAIYCIPSNAQHVLKVDLITKTTSFIDIEYDQTKYPDFALNQTNKWYGGIPGTNDQCVYGIPYRSCAVLQIDTANDKARLIGPNYGLGKYNWHGGINVKGTIYAHPSHANTVLAIRTHHLNPDDTTIEELPISDGTATRNTLSGGDIAALTSNDDYAPQHPKQTYKWLGGAVGQDGNIYCPACDTNVALCINTQTGHCTTFGHAGYDKNKWQGGMLSPRDGCIYCIPASGKHVLRIFTNTAPGQPPTLQLLGDLPHHKDKWQGGHVGLDGCLYFIPENGYRVLKVTPPMAPPQLVNGKLPENDVILEYL